jgi:hypothetical protein
MKKEKEEKEVDSVTRDLRWWYLIWRRGHIGSVERGQRQHRILNTYTVCVCIYISIRAWRQQPNISASPKKKKRKNKIVIRIPYLFLLLLLFDRLPMKWKIKGLTNKVAVKLYQRTLFCCCCCYTLGSEFKKKKPSLYSNKRLGIFPRDRCI